VRGLHRPGVKLPTLTTGVGARRAAEQAGDPDERSSFPPHWNASDVRGALRAMHGRVCAYCLSELTRGDRGDVEHFRPKKLYFWLAYAFENYLLSCARCNRICKRDHFPLAPPAARVERLFLDPVADPVERWLVLKCARWWSWDPAADLAAGTLERERVVETIRWFEWNTDPELLKDRDDAVDEALDAFDRGDHDKARRCASRFRPQGGAVRSVLASFPGFALPTADDELAWLLDDLLEDWRWAKAVGGPLCEERIEELGWALAVLWKAPPPGAGLDVGAWLDERKLRAEVEPKYRQI
jgi:uncharacterized protein (TIGR02646 family)